jgi:phosphoribosylformylglycinamidine synthase
VRGIADACSALDLAVVSGNVSFYNESPEGPIHPTPIIGMLGVISDVQHSVGAGFRATGDKILLLGDVRPPESMAASEYLFVRHGVEAGRPAAVDLDLEGRLQNVVRSLVKERAVHSAHDCSEGGLGVALAECCVSGGVGAGLSLPFPTSAAALFGEAPSRVVVSAPHGASDRVRDVCAAHQVPMLELGRVGGERLVVGNGVLDLPLSELEAAWERTIPTAMQP